MAEKIIQNDFDAAVAHHYAGRLREAEMLYRKILAREPENAEVLHRLGVLAGQVSRHEVALELLRKTVSLQPTFYGAHYSLGDALRNNGNLDEAIASYQQSISLNPNYLNAHNNLGNVFRDKGQLIEAIASYRRALAISPDYPEALINLGDALRLTGQVPQAIDCLERAVALLPKNPLALSLLGLALHAAGRFDESIPRYRQALAMAPGNLQALNNIPGELGEMGQFDEATMRFRRALTISPIFAQAHSNLGAALLDTGQVEEAIMEYRRAMAVSPRFAESPQSSVAVSPGKAAFGDHPQAHVVRSPSSSTMVESHSNLLFSLNFLSRLDAATVFQEHRRWDQQHAPSPKDTIEPHRNDPSPDRRLKIGYVSSDFKEHSVAYFLEGILAHHDPAAVEVFCYANVKAPDAVTARLRRLAHQWRETTTDEQTAAKVREDQIDILIDLSGHTCGNRLLAFARKPAPIQVTYLGYPNTTGLSTIDYRLTDAFADPPGLTDAFHSETLVRLPNTFLCFRPAENSPPVAPLPAPTAGQITFGSFNTLPKITAEIVAVWSRVLHGLPNSRLMLKNKGLNDTGGRRRLLDVFAAAGISTERLDLRNWATTRTSHLELYNQVDIVLDTYPYHGTTTTCEALWMGVPVVTLAGTAHRSRVGVSILSNVGLQELIAQTPDQFAQIAMELANDLPRLAALRAGLRDRMRQSPLTDAPRFARNVESAYRQMWRTWCASG